MTAARCGPSSLLVAGGGSAARIHASASQAEARHAATTPDAHRRWGRPTGRGSTTRGRCRSAASARTNSRFYRRQPDPRAAAARSRRRRARRQVRPQLLGHEDARARQHLGMLDEETAQLGLVHLVAEHVRDHRLRHRQRRGHGAAAAATIVRRAELDEPEVVQRRARRGRPAASTRRRRLGGARGCARPSPRRGRRACRRRARAFDRRARRPLVDLGREREQEEIERQRLEPRPAPASAYQWQRDGRGRARSRAR